MLIPGSMIKSHRFLLLFCSLILLMGAFGLRLYNIDMFSFWSDESLTSVRANYDVPQILRNDIVVQAEVTKDTHPPFYYLLIHLTRHLWGESDFAYRFPSVLASLLLVPLLFQFGKRLHGIQLGLIVAVLTAVNPLHIWYANEARMYTLFMLLMAGAAYALWRAVSGGKLRRWLVIYLLLAGLGLYTHYTAVFLIAAQSPFWFWLLWHNGQKKLIIAGGVVAVLVAIPLIPYTIPRLFTGPEATYIYLSPIIILQDMVRFFSLGMTVDFGQPVVILLANLTFILLLIGFYAVDTTAKRLFLAIYLLAVILGLIVGSLLKPMYLGVRHIMVSSPAFLLLLAWAILFIGQKSANYSKNSLTQRRRDIESKKSLPHWLVHRVRIALSPKERVLWRVAFIMSLLTLALGPLLSLNNLYNRHDIYAKDDYRSLIRQIAAMVGENDVVVYNDAIHLFLHDHYYVGPDVAVTAVPGYPHPVAYSAEADLTHIAQTYDRIWFVSDPPTDGRDDEGFVQHWLTTKLLPLTVLIAHARSATAEALAFSTLNTHAETLPNAESLAITWPGLSPLQAVQIDSTQPITNQTIWIQLYWEATPILPETAVLRFSLHDSQGQEWTAITHPAYPTTSQLPPTGLIQLPYWLPLPRAIPPGQYELRLQPFVDTQAIAPAHPITAVTIAATPPPSVPWFAPQRLHFDNGLQLAGWEWADTAVYPGHNLPLTLYWQTDTPLTLSNLRYELTIYQADGSPLRQQAGRPGAAWLTDLPAPSLIREQTGIYVRPETPPGRYRLQWRLLADEQIIPGRPAWRPWSTESVILGYFQVAEWPLETSLPTDVTPVGATFGPHITLHGYQLHHTDDQLQLHLTWQTDAHLHNDLTLFVHLLTADNEVIDQVDRIPGNGLRPLSGWRAGEVITDEIQFTLPATAPPGSYQIMVGFYHPEEGYRLPVMRDGQPQLYDQLLLTSVSVP